MFSCNNNNGSIFTDSVFWVVVVTAIIILWVHYSSEHAINPLTGEGNGEYCC